MTKCSLSKLERETIISWNDFDNSQFHIYTTQQPFIRKLLRNPMFVLKEKKFNSNYSCHPQPICVEGYLPLKCLTIRTKKRKISPKEKRRLQEHMKKIREQRKKTNKKIMK